MKGYIYICEMIYKEETYYKIGKALNVTKREAELKIGNPFLSVIAFKISTDYQKEEKDIHHSLKDSHFAGEWFKLSKNEYINLYKTLNFSEFSDDEREEQKKFGYTTVPFRKPITYTPIPLKGAHVFRKQKKLKDGKIVHKWYYYFYSQEGKKIQKACRECHSRTEAENFIRKLPEFNSEKNTEVNKKGQPLIVNA